MLYCRGPSNVVANVDHAESDPCNELWGRYAVTLPCRSAANNKGPAHTNDDTGGLDTDATSYHKHQNNNTHHTHTLYSPSKSLRPSLVHREVPPYKGHVIVVPTLNCTRQSYLALSNTIRRVNTYLYVGPVIGTDIGVCVRVCNVLRTRNCQSAPPVATTDPAPLLLGAWSVQTR
jgi:hypothetical protein